MLLSRCHMYDYIIVEKKTVNSPWKDWLFIKQPLRICLQWNGVNYSILLGQCAPLLGAYGGLDRTG